VTAGLSRFLRDGGAERPGTNGRFRRIQVATNGRACNDDLMRWFWGVALVVVGCSSSYGAQGLPDPLTNDGGVDTPPPGDAGPTGTLPDGAAVVDAGADAADAADAAEPRPFDSFIALRFETDAPNGLQVNGAWRDLSKAARSVSIATGTPVVQFSGDAGARAMVFGATGPIFEVPDSADLRFGTTDDFMIVARTTIEVPAGSGSGCAFHYLFAKYSNTDGASGPHLRVCADPGRNLIGSLKLVSSDATVAVPPVLTTTYGVVSFGRNVNGTRIETYAGGTSIEVNVPSLVDVSSVGSPFMVGGFRGSGTGGTGGSWLGKVNRLYVYHAPGGTFSAADFATIRAFVKDAAPLP